MAAPKKNYLLVAVASLLIGTLAWYFIGPGSSPKSTSRATETESDLSKTNRPPAAPGSLPDARPADAAKPPAPIAAATPTSQEREDTASSEGPTPAAEVADRMSTVFPEAKLIAESETKTPEGHLKKSKIVLTQFKFPKVRVLEERAGGVLIRQEFMAAAHLLVTLKSEDQYESFEKNLRQLNSEVIRRQNPTLLLVKVPNADQPDSLERFKEALQGLTELKYAPEPDRVRTLFR